MTNYKLSLIILEWVFCCNYPIKSFHSAFQIFLVLNSPFFVNQYFSSKGNFAPLETVSIIIDIVDCHEMVRERMHFWHLAGRGRGAPKHPTLHKTASCKKELCGRTPVTPSLRNLVLIHLYVFCMVVLQPYHALTVYISYSP